MPNYIDNNIEELKQIQSNLEVETNLPLQGAVGGLPVAEKNQAYFAVFDEAGDTGPEILDKTQFRITYIVDSELNTGKPLADGIASLNTTQNFEKGSNVLIRADNATVLNKEITDLQKIYDVGTLTLLSTSEYGVNKGEYITTMSFNGVRGSSGVVDNIQGNYKIEDEEDNLVSGGENNIINFNNSVFPIPLSSQEYVEFINNQKFILQQPTSDIGTSIKLKTEFVIQARGVDDVQNATVNLVRKKGVEIEILNSQNFIFNNPGNQVPFTAYTQSVNFTLESPFSQYDQSNEFYVEIINNNNSNQPSYNLPPAKFTIAGGNFRLIQDVTPGAESEPIQGLNYAIEPYWNKIFTTVDNSYSIISASDEFRNFIQGDHIPQLSDIQKSFSPKNDGNTFHPTFAPLTFEPGDEIRFEYNPNKVHKIFKVEQLGEFAIFVTPALSQDTLVNHFTHYRIIKNGGYLIINQEKNNEAGTSQPFQGIILPQFPTEQLKKKEDKLILDLKKAGIIQN